MRMNKKRTLLALCGIFICQFLGFSQTSSYDENHLFSPSELRDDFHYFRNKLEKTDPGLNLYTTMNVWNAFCDSLSDLLNKPMTEKDFYNILCLLNTKLRDGHIHIFPGEMAMTHFNKQSRFLPFRIVINGEKLWVIENNSGDKRIGPGNEILSINGKSANAIIDDLMTRQIRDGQNDTYPRWILNTYFKEYYGFHFGHPDHFLIRYSADRKSGRSVVIKALTKDSIRFYQALQHTGNTNRQSDSLGISLDCDETNSTALLTIKTFDIELLNSKYHQQYDQTLRDNFSLIRKKEIKRLIIDLRNNQGGDVEVGGLLISFLSRQPFKMLNAYYKLDTLQNNQFGQMIQPAKGAYMGIHQPEPNAFMGKLYVLINGGSFSNSGIVSSALRRMHRAIFLGEETGGNKDILCGDPESYTLPHTQIEVEVPTLIYEITHKSLNTGHGTMPDHRIIPSVNSMVRQQDEVLDYVNELINKDKH